MNKAILHFQNKTEIINFNSPVMLSELLKNTAGGFSMPCGGKGKCGKCKIKVIGNLSSLSEKEENFLSKNEIENNIRLACMTGVYGDIELFFEKNENRILTHEEDYIGEINTFGSGYGIAVDIGTTTVTSALINLKDGKNLAVSSIINPQSKFGADVVSRMESAVNGNDVQLKKELIFAIEIVKNDLIKKTGIDEGKIDCVFICGNTAMLYLLTGEDVREIIVPPFKISNTFGRFYENDELGFPFSKNTKIYLSKCIGAYIGSDITNGLISMFCSERADKNKKYLYVDIGTNGEIALIHDGRISCCSTAVGPAFEGANISCGTVSCEGAIDKIYIENNELKFSVIGDVEPIGLTGSAMIDILSEFIKWGVIDNSGKIIETDHISADNLEYIGGELSVRIRENIYITQSDIISLQLAKSAVMSAIEICLMKNNISPNEIDEFLIAGGFGKSINLKSAEKIGLFPGEFTEKARYFGNGALKGTVDLMMNKNNEILQNNIISRADIFELSDEDLFEKKFTENMMFS